MMNILDTRLEKTSWIPYVCSSQCVLRCVWGVLALRTWECRLELRDLLLRHLLAHALDQAFLHLGAGQ